MTKFDLFKVTPIALQGIVDKISDRLNKQDQIVGGIERKIPELSESFSKTKFFNL